MKKVMRFTLAAFFAVGITASCKDKETETDDMSTDTELIEADNTTTAQDTTATLNDTNVSGTTSGSMEQVP